VFVEQSHKILVLWLLILSSTATFSQEKSIETHPQTVPPQQYLKEFIPNLLKDTKEVYSEDNIRYFILSVVASGVAFSQDDKVREFWLENEPLGDWKDLGNNFGGNGNIHLYLALGFLGIGQLADNPKLDQTGQVLIEAGIISGLTTNILKGLTHRQRPNQSDYASYPSGHATTAFTFASVIDRELGHKWGIPAYALALFTGLSRMESDAHWLSDVVMGAGIGMIVGYAVSKAHDNPPNKKFERHPKKQNLLNSAILVPIVPEAKETGLGIGFFLPLD